MRVELSFIIFRIGLTMHSINIQMRGYCSESELRAAETMAASWLWLTKTRGRPAGGISIIPWLWNSIAHLISGHTLVRAVHITGFNSDYLRSQRVCYKILSVDRSALTSRSLPPLSAFKYTATMSSEQSVDIQSMSDKWVIQDIKWCRTWQSRSLAKNYVDVATLCV
jgi:hypothetical protein